MTDSPRVGSARISKRALRLTSTLGKKSNRSRILVVSKPTPSFVSPVSSVARRLPLAQRLVETLNERCRPSIPWVSYDRELLDKVAEELHVRRDILDALDGGRHDEMSELFDNIINRKMSDSLIVRKLAEVIRALAVHGHAVMVGRGSSLVTQDLPTACIFVWWRPGRSIPSPRSESQTLQQAEKTVEEGEKQRRHYLETFFVIDPAQPFLSGFW